MIFLCRRELLGSILGGSLFASRAAYSAQSSAQSSVLLPSEDHADDAPPPWGDEDADGPPPAYEEKQQSASSSRASSVARATQSIEASASPQSRRIEDSLSSSFLSPEDSSFRTVTTDHGAATDGTVIRGHHDGRAATDGTDHGPTTDVPDHIISATSSGESPARASSPLAFLGRELATTAGMGNLTTRSSDNDLTSSPEDSVAGAAEEVAASGVDRTSPPSSRNYEEDQRPFFQKDDLGKSKKAQCDRSIFPKSCPAHGAPSSPILHLRRTDFLPRFRDLFQTLLQRYLGSPQNDDEFGVDTQSLTRTAKLTRGLNRRLVTPFFQSVWVPRFAHTMSDRLVRNFAPFLLPRRHWLAIAGSPQPPLTSMSPPPIHGEVKNDPAVVINPPVHGEKFDAVIATRRIARTLEQAMLGESRNCPGDHDAGEETRPGTRDFFPRPPTFVRHGLDEALDARLREVFRDTCDMLLAAEGTGAEAEQQQSYRDLTHTLEIFSLPSEGQPLKDAVACLVDLDEAAVRETERYGYVLNNRTSVRSC